MGIEFYADESISDFSDILKLKNQVSGANIKLEKIGGILEAV
jgi:L-alanine-DL-glutamate epimerase-like enolase superfamily enzyme